MDFLDTPSKDLNALQAQHIEELAIHHAPLINAKIDQFDKGADAMQIQAFGFELKSYLKASNLSFVRRYHVKTVGVNPCN